MNKSFEGSPLAKFLFTNPKFSWFWFIARIYVGYQWVEAGWGKFTGSGWVGDGAGSALNGFMQGALSKATGAHPDVQSWYAGFIKGVVLPHVSLWSHLVTYGEILVGVALIIGAFTGIAAFFGFFMNLNFMLAGSVSINPILLIIEILLVIAWRTAGNWGVDRFLLPALGTTWQPGKAFRKK